MHQCVLIVGETVHDNAMILYIYVYTQNDLNVVGNDSQECHELYVFGSRAMSLSSTFNVRLQLWLDKNAIAELQERFVFMMQ